MPFDASESFFSPLTLLWLAASAVAAWLLFASINHRRSQLTDSLRDYVKKNQQGSTASKPGQDAASLPTETEDSPDPPS